MFKAIPIIGLAGGIGSGKSYVARIFGDLGCLIIDSDEQVTQAYGLPEVRKTLEEWWGPTIYLADGKLDRRAVAARIFNDPAARRRLEGLIHPVVARLRDEVMENAVRTNPPVAFIWDAPLLFEAGLHPLCDAVVFVDAPLPERVDRVRRTRGWDAAELLLREKSQWPLDKKRALSHDVITNTASTAFAEISAQAQSRDQAAVSGNAAAAGPLRDQVRLVLSRILSENSGRRRERGLE